MIEALLSAAAIVCSLSAVVVVFKAAKTPAAKTLNPINSIPNFSKEVEKTAKVEEVKIPLELKPEKSNVAYVKIVLPEKIQISEEALVKVVYESLFSSGKQDEKKQ